MALAPDDGDQLFLGYSGVVGWSYTLTPRKNPLAPLVYESFSPVLVQEGLGSPAQPIQREEVHSFSPVFSQDILGKAPVPPSTLAVEDTVLRYEGFNPSPLILYSLGQGPAPNPPQNLDVGSTPNITVAGFAPTLLEQEMLDVPYGISTLITGFPPELVEDNDNGLIVGNTPTITITGFAPDLLEDDGLNESLLVGSTADITVTGFAPDLLETEFLDVATSSPLIQIFADPPTLDEQGLLPPILSYADAKIVWDLLLFDGMSPRDMLRYIAASVLGRTRGSLKDGPGTIVIRLADNSRDAIVCKYDDDDNRLEVTLLPLS